MIDAKLNSLMQIVQTGSFTKAAEQLSLTQPAISRHVRLLEEELQVKLFDRVRGELRLTREGEVVVKYAKRMLALNANLHQALKDEKQQITSLTVGLTHTVESSAIVGTLADYVNIHDGVTMKVVTDTADKLSTMLNSYELDFAIVEGRLQAPNLRYMMLDTDNLVLAVPPRHPLANQGTVTIDQLKQEKMILRLPKSNTRNLFEASLESINMRMEDFNVVLEIDNIATIKDLVRQDLGVSVLARSACLNELKKGKIVALSIENLNMLREINLVYRQDFEHPELLHGLVQSYRQIIP